MTKISLTRTHRLIRQLAGGHKSMRIDIVFFSEENLFPQIIGKPWTVEVQNVRFYRIQGKPKMYYQVRYIRSTQKIIVGNKFYDELLKCCHKKKGNLKLYINDSNEFKLPNIEAGKFIINNYPIKHSDFKIV